MLEVRVVVDKKELEQWFLKTTEYADELLDFTYKLPGWPEMVLTSQRNWIGKSIGAEIDFAIEGTKEKLTVFTTRPDTLYGTTFMSLAPEHPLVAEAYDRRAGKRGQGICEKCKAEKSALSSGRRANKRGRLYRGVLRKPFDRREVCRYTPRTSS